LLLSKPGPFRGDGHGSKGLKELSIWGRSRIDASREPCSPIAPIRVVIIVHDSEYWMLVYFRAKLVAGLFATRLFTDRGRGINTSEDKLRVVRRCWYRPRHIAEG
jgi:hypothetical protein